VTERHRLLVVEDDTSLATVLEAFFRSLPWLDTVVCRSLADAETTLAEGFSPDAALVDFVLGHGDSAVDLCRRIKDWRPDCVLFVMSGCVVEEIARSAIDADVDCFLEKPFSLAVLELTLSRALRTSDGWPAGPCPLAPGHVGRLRDLVARHPDETAYRRVLAFSLFVSERYDEAARLYESVMVDDTGFLAVYYAGHSYARLDEDARAVELWNRAAERAPTAVGHGRVKRCIEMVQARD